VDTRFPKTTSPGVGRRGQWARIQKPAVACDIVSYYRKAVCPNKCVCNVAKYFFVILVTPFLLKIAKVIFELEIHCMRAKTVKK
jgi:hypothetical protein